MFTGATVIAVVCDFAENLCLLMMIYYTPDDLYAGLAYIFASVKFLLLGAAVTHFSISGMAIILKKPDEQL